MAAQCFAITAISRGLSEHLDVINEIKLYQTCSAIDTGNREHLKVLADLRSHRLGALTPGTEGQIDVPPFIRYAWKFALSSYMIVGLTSSQTLTNQEPVAGDRSGDQHPTKVVFDPAAFPHNASAPEEIPVDIFAAPRQTRWECTILFSMMITLWVSCCWEVGVGRAQF